MLVAAISGWSALPGGMSLAATADDLGQADVRGKIESGLTAGLVQGAQDVMVEFDVSPGFSSVAGLSWQDRGRRVHEILLETTGEAQKEAVSWWDA